MKFAKYLAHNQVPEWSRRYVAYKALKVIIKRPDTSELQFRALLTAEVGKVESFFCKKVGSTSDTDTLLKLRRYAVDNAEGIRKIAKKWDKKRGHGGNAVEASFNPPTIDGLECSFVQARKIIADILVRGIKSTLPSNMTKEIEQDTLSEWTEEQRPLVEQAACKSKAINVLRRLGRFNAELLLDHEDAAALLEKLGIKDASLLDACVKRGKVEAFKTILDGKHWWEFGLDEDLLATAVASGQLPMVKLLLSEEHVPLVPTLLILAVRVGRLKVLCYLLESGRFDVDAGDEDGETALYHACKLGKKEMAEALLAKNADPLKGEDSRGWTPLIATIAEGHCEIISLFPSDHPAWTRFDANGWSPLEHGIFRGSTWLAKYAPKAGKEGGSAQRGLQLKEELPEREYGHLFMDRKSQLRVDIKQVVVCRGDVSKIKVVHAGDELLVIDLPTSAVFDSIVIDVEDGKSADILVTAENANGNVIGQAILLGIPGDFHVGIPGDGKLVVKMHGFVGLITPFGHAKLTKELGKIASWPITRIIGHRGTGADVAGSSHIDENSLLSFQAAAMQGAEYVEFDVQVTKDDVPVLHHDWIVKGATVPVVIGQLSLKEFLQLRPRVAVKDSQEWHHPDRKIQKTIRAQFATLEEALKQLPLSLGFNVEVKYPMPMELLKHGIPVRMAGCWQAINEYVDAILKVIFDHADTPRPIIFSSFHPEVCMALSLKQPRYPVFFLTIAKDIRSGGSEEVDARCTSLQAAIRFAKALQLSGIVCESGVLQLAPRLIAVVRQSGLLLFTYGHPNNDSEWAQQQRALGVDAVIVDTVASIHRAFFAI